LSYNDHVFKNPLQFGQTKISKRVAQYKTGNTDVWKTPLWKGLSGLLLSPSRGLFIYSPFFLFALWGLIVVWRGKDRLLQCFSFAGFFLILTASKWFDWWGGVDVWLSSHSG